MNVSNFLLANKYGCWISNGIPFTSKLSALNYGSRQGNASVSFYYHDHIWQNFDRSLLGKIPLTDLYKERALQLRNKYDYLILHYSGGSDSHNILHTFLTNNIKLDEISVRWIKPLRDGKFYTPNTIDKSARNAASEWDFAIKPTLDWIAANRPEIKINVIDYANNLTDGMIKVESIEKRLNYVNFNKGGLGFFSMWANPDFEQLISTKENACHIFGIEKPIIYIKENEVYFQFMDNLLEMSMLPQAKADNRAEMFYWSPDLPLLAMEQAYQIAMFLKNNLHLRKYIWDDQALPIDDILKKFNDQGEIFKKILYSDSWITDRFQVKKPNLLRSDWYFWIYENQELSSLKRNWEISMNNLTSNIDKRLLMSAGQVNLLRPIKTKPFHLLSLK